jgi:NADH-quinone oxidoreductase subunit A
MIFDVEAALLFAWAGAAREVGRPGLIAATVFVALLLAALAYLWADGALDTGPKRRARDQA